MASAIWGISRKNVSHDFDRTGREDERKDTWGSLRWRSCGQQLEKTPARWLKYLFRYIIIRDFFNRACIQSSKWTGSTINHDWDGWSRENLGTIGQVLLCWSHFSLPGPLCATWLYAVLYPITLDSAPVCTMRHRMNFGCLEMEENQDGLAYSDSLENHPLTQEPHTFVYLSPFYTLLQCSWENVSKGTNPCVAIERPNSIARSKRKRTSFHLAPFLGIA